MLSGKRLVVLLLSVILIVALLAGCGGAKTAQQPSGDNGQTAQSSSDQQKTTTGPEPLTLPIVKEPLTLTWFGQPESFITDTMKDYSEMTVMKELEKRTGIHVEFHVPPAGQLNEQLNLMLATGETDDMMWDVFSAPGGAVKLLSDKIILPLNDLIAQYAPNIKKLLDDNPELRKQISSDDGSIYMIPEARLDQVLKINAGFQIRKDWLDKLGLQIPTNIDEWYNVLKAFKEKDPNGNGQADEIPFLSQKDASFSNFVEAWGLLNGFYQENGKVKYGPIDPKYKEFLQTMAQWYKEGLIDPEYASTDGKGFDAKVTGQKGGAYFGAMSGTLGRYTNLMQNDPNFKLAGVPFPKGSSGKAYNTQSPAARYAAHGVSIGAKDSHLKETIKWLDYHFTDEGLTLLNWGIEGQSYTVKDGKKVFTDLILKNPDGLTLEQAAAKYAGGTICQMPVIGDPEVYRQLKLALPQQKEASAQWGSADISLLLPPITPTPDESARFSAIMSEVNTYADEMFNKFIMGKESLDNFDNYVATIKNLGIDEAIKIQQAALDRYNARK